MVIRVMYPNKKFDMVKDSLLNKLITSGKIVKFFRSGAWVTIGQDPTRGSGGVYYGFERRQRAAPSDMRQQ
jgi:hypothetical protein